VKRWHQCLNAQFCYGIQPCLSLCRGRRDTGELADKAPCIGESSRNRVWQISRYAVFDGPPSGCCSTTVWHISMGECNLHRSATLRACILTHACHGIRNGRAWPDCIDPSVDVMFFWVLIWTIECIRSDWIMNSTCNEAHASNSSDSIVIAEDRLKPPVVPKCMFECLQACAQSCALLAGTERAHPAAVFTARPRVLAS